jgi:rod shape-determining protein MreD
MKTIRRVITLALLIIINFVLQSTVFGYHSAHSITPNLLLILTMSFGIMRGRREGMLVGFFCGLLVDIFFNTLLGPYMLLYMVIGYVNGFFHQNFMLEDVLFPLIVVIVDDYVFNTCVYVFAYMLKNRLEYGSYFVKIILPEMLATALLTIIIYKLYVYINRRLKE